MYAQSTSLATAALTKSGQASVPRIVADQLGAEYGKDRIEYFRMPDGTIAVRKIPSLWEAVEAFHDSLNPEEKQALKELGRELDHKSVGEYLADWGRSPEGQAYFKEKYGL